MQPENLAILNPAKIKAAVKMSPEWIVFWILMGFSIFGCFALYKAYNK